MNATQSIPPSQTPRPKRTLRSVVGWIVAGLFILGAAWGAGRGESKGIQVDVDAGRIAVARPADVAGAMPGLKKYAQILPKYNLKTRFRVRWQEVAGGKTVACALHFDRDENTLDYYRDTVWQDGYDNVNDTIIIIASRSIEGLPRLKDMGATQSPHPTPAPQSK